MACKEWHPNNLVSDWPIVNVRARGPVNLEKFAHDVLLRPLVCPSPEEIVCNVIKKNVSDRRVRRSVEGQWRLPEAKLAAGLFDSGGSRLRLFAEPIRQDCVFGMGILVASCMQR